MSPFCGYIPSPSARAPLKGGHNAFLFPVQTLCAWNSSEVFPRLLCSMAFKASTDTWSFLITCLGLFHTLNTRLCSQPTLEYISHESQAKVLLFQSISQTTSLVHRHTPPKIAVNKIFQVCFLGLWLGTSVAFATISEFLIGSNTLKSHSLKMAQVHWGSSDYHVRILSYCKRSENDLFWEVYGDLKFRQVYTSNHFV